MWNTREHNHWASEKLNIKMDHYILITIKVTIIGNFPKQQKE